ncbi:hypothetical protein EGR_03570 [Echinococcus granulosus]|uniref:Uncharacterized protein n=1 Tax=Echinococcus granulosus TaxID=6210 RepID=W6UK39_ECHGR|nr:hypothetical protein EGR_03570 [Echinococcus granulosus]EUB61506.1 hypothetical protein EGR_03570 [Echinococcus granulosus]
MSEKGRLTRMYMPFYAACGFTATGFILFLFSFSSPYWLESYDYREVEHYEAVEGQFGARSVAAGTYLTGRQPSTLFTRSVYGNQPRMGGGVVVSVPAPGDAPTQTVEIGTANFYSGSGPTGSQLSPLREDPLTDDRTLGDQGSGTYASSENTGTHQQLGRGQYSNNDTPTHSLLYGYHRGQV